MPARRDVEPDLRAGDLERAGSPLEAGALRWAMSRRVGATVIMAVCFLLAVTASFAAGVVRLDRLRPELEAKHRCSERTMSARA